jgi:ParB-like chromosome segregation protein Spo0J
MPILSLDHLDDHPLNANVMQKSAFEKLLRHVESSGDYPPLIVRRHPLTSLAEAGRFQILDGHHRARALRALGHEEVRCEIWEADDERAIVLLLTLNRLHGEDDPQKRGELLTRMHSARTLVQMAEIVPDEIKRIEALMAVARPTPIADIAPPPNPEAMPQVITFFLTEPQRRRLFERLSAIDGDRSRALVKLLNLEAE